MSQYEEIASIQEVAGEWKVVRFWTGRYGIVDPYGTVVSNPLDAPIGARNLLFKYQKQQF